MNVACFVLLIMLLLQPLAGLNIAVAQSNFLSSAASGTSSGTPPPAPLNGSVMSTRTWNQTQTISCPSANLPSEPLVEKRADWTIASGIPRTSFAGTPSGNVILHAYTFLPNGTFVARDNYGNHYGWSGIKGLPAGSTKVTLAANSTAAVQRFVVTSGQQIIANVSVSFKVRQSDCAPAGLKVTIAGEIQAGPAAVERIGLQFDRQELRVEGTRAWLGNTSGVMLGFDWSDSVNQNPTFDPKSSSITWPAGSKFSEDIAKAAAFLLSDDASWITGVAMPVDGGYLVRH